MILSYAHLVSTVFMAGLIWFVQVVHYPLFHKVHSDKSIPYALAHQRRTSWVVGLPMIVEGFSTIWLFINPIDGRLLPLVGGLILATIHLSTVFLQVPKHASLTNGYSPQIVDQLIRTNWIRTIGWSVRLVIAVAITASV
tara:strand:- start:66 stop:485 length:420 start_codon:yes stop_codon:yes gene_type:complete